MPDHDKYTEQTLINSAPHFTSLIRVQAGHRINIGVFVGNSLDFLAADSGAVNSTASMSLTLQRKMPGDVIGASVASWDTAGIGPGGWRDVESWSLLAADGYDASFEIITDKDEPESGTMYRIGTKIDAWESGSVYVRLGTS